MKIKLTKTIKAGEKNLDELTLDFERFTVRDYLTAVGKAQSKANPEQMQMAEFDTGLHLAVALQCAVRCNPGLDFIDLETQLSGKDIPVFIAAGRSFFFDAAGE